VYVGAEELYDYFKGRAAKYGVDEFVKLNHHIQSATWDDELGKWVVNITNLKTGESIRDEAELFIYGAGFLKQVIISIRRELPLTVLPATGSGQKFLDYTTSRESYFILLDGMTHMISKTRRLRSLDPEVQPSRSCLSYNQVCP
jgi:hypothetical protein